MAIKHVNGDLLNAEEDIIGHQVNCQGVMGSGVAKVIRAKYPEVFDQYSSYVQDRSFIGATPILGSCQTVECHDGKRVANLFGQDNYNKGGVRKQMTDESALRLALHSLRTYAEERNLSVALPYKIGSDRGGADWEVVKEIIDEEFHGYYVTLYRL